MGKNTMMKRSIRLFCERTGNEEWPGLVDSLVGNVGLIFTKGDLNEVCRLAALNQLGPQYLFLLGKLHISFSKDVKLQKLPRWCW